MAEKNTDTKKSVFKVLFLLSPGIFYLLYWLTVAIIAEIKDPGQKMFLQGMLLSSIGWIPIVILTIVIAGLSLTMVAQETRKAVIRARAVFLAVSIIGICVIAIFLVIFPLTLYFLPDPLISPVIVFALFIAVITVSVTEANRAIKKLNEVGGES